MLDPHHDMGFPAELIEVEIDHTSSGYRCRGSHGQVLDFEQEADVGRKGDTVTVVEGEQLVIVKHRVHGLDPESVNGTVKDHPSHLDLVDSVGLDEAHLLEDVGKDSIIPLRRVLVIEVAEELIDADGLGVDDFVLHSLVLRLVHHHALLLLFLVKLVQSVHQNLPALGLSGLSLSDQHVSVSSDLRLIQLHDLDDQVLVQLQVLPHERFLDSDLEVVVVVLGLIAVGEQIDEEVVE
mmetsp:Transcript_20737/g.31922  ORF Transcript_20737/g.31922 Transcript_20737/m.31922 type:complete len:237 (+) Transcript_20737:6666-7376(+)